MSREKGYFRTQLVHGDDADIDHGGSASVPIYLTSTFKREGAGESKEEPFGRGRMGNPTKEALEKQLALLEGAEYAFAFPSGTSAIGSVVASFRSGDTVLVGNAVFGGTVNLLKKIFGNYGIGFRFVDTLDLKNFEDSITDDVKAVIIETPSNPTLLVTDLEEFARIAKKHGVLTIVDNTFMSPYLQKPLKFGIDVVIESGTKYLAGHNDLVAGFVATNNKDLADWLKAYQWQSGVRIQPFDAFLLLRGIKTLSVRIDRQTENALSIAEYLEKNSLVTKIYYPGLSDSQGYDIQKKQAAGPGAVLAFELDEKVNIPKFLGALEWIFFGGSLGGGESLISHPASSSQRSLPDDIKKATYISDRLIRLSVGIEDVRDLIGDIEQALKKATL